jgi:hypothetical protein
VEGRVSGPEMRPCRESFSSHFSLLKPVSWRRRGAEGLHICGTFVVHCGTLHICGTFVVHCCTLHICGTFGVHCVTHLWYICGCLHAQLHTLMPSHVYAFALYHVHSRMSSRHIHPQIWCMRVDAAYVARVHTYADAEVHERIRTHTCANMSNHLYVPQNTHVRQRRRCRAILPWWRGWGRRQCG